LGYWKAKADLEFAEEYRGAVTGFWKAERIIELHNSEGRYHRHNLHREELQEYDDRLQRAEDDYIKLREEIAKGIKAATIIADEQGTTYSLISYPAPAVGGPVIPVNIFQAILNDTSHGGVGNKQILDALNEMIGSCEQELRVQKRHLLNPLYWPYAILVFLVQIPFRIFQLSGFDVNKIEEHLLAKLFKVLEVLVIIYILLRLGFTHDQLHDLVTRVFK
jgi:hypothetical protein